MSSSNWIYDAQFSALAKSIASSFRTQLPPNTISNIVDLESLKSTLTAAIPASVTADLLAQSPEWVKYLSDLSSPISFESVKSIASAASQLFANYDFSQITKAYSPDRDNNEPAPDEEVDVPPEVYELVHSIEEATATPISSQGPEVAEVIKHRPQKMSAETLRFLISIFITIAIALCDHACDYIQSSANEEAQNLRDQRIISLLEEDAQLRREELESSRHTEDDIEAIRDKVDRLGDMFEQICLYGVPTRDGVGQLEDEVHEPVDAGTQLPEVDTQAENNNSVQNTTDEVNQAQP